jgi:effector-binding domain-containing protein
MSVRLRKHASDIPAAFGKYLPRIGVSAGRLGARFGGPPFLLYHGIVDGKLDVEIGMPLALPLAGLHPVDAGPEGSVGASQLPGGRVAMYVYRGPYEGLGNAWADLNSWLTDHGLTATEKCWESYIDNPDAVPAEELRTELYQLLA